MNQKDFARRRRQLMRMIGKGGIAILPAAPTRVRNRDTEYAYRQDSDFHYLTNFPEPEAVAVLMPGRPHGEFVLFCRDRDPERETWDGYRAGPEGAVRDFGADDAFPISDIDDILPGMLEHSERVYYTMGLSADFDQRLLGWVNQLRAAAKTGVTTPTEFVALDHLLHDMRLFKSRSEITVMRKAARIAAAAHVRAMQACKPGKWEYEIEAEFLHEFRRHNATTSYQPIVGGGANGCILHYVENKDQLKEGELLLIDAGCEYDSYASDITRTFPVSGRFSPAQRALYEVVLEAQLAAIDKVRPGNHWDDPHDAAVRVLTRGLVKLGLLKGRVPTLVKSGAYRRF
jgi:Xaa-Pro aminopeptidase